MRPAHLHKPFGTLLHRKCASPLPSTQVLICLHQRGLMDTYICWIIIQCALAVLLSFRLAIRSFQSAPGHFWLTPTWCVFSFLSEHFLLNTRCSRLTYALPPVLDSAISPEGLGSCYWRMVSQTKTWELGMLRLLGCVQWDFNTSLKTTDCCKGVFNVCQIPVSL